MSGKKFLHSVYFTFTTFLLSVYVEAENKKKNKKKAIIVRIWFSIVHAAMLTY